MLVVGNHDVRPTFAVRAVFNKAKGAVNSRRLYTRDQLLPYEAFLTEAKQALNSRKLHARAKFCPRSEITKCDVNRPKPLPSAQNPRNAPHGSRSERKFADALRERPKNQAAVQQNMHTEDRRTNRDIAKSRSKRLHNAKKAIN